MIDPKQFRVIVVRPTLARLAAAGIQPAGAAVENLLLGTALVESRLSWLRQRAPGGGLGPARGVFQVEPATHDDVWSNYLAFRPELASTVRSLASQRWPGGIADFETRHGELATNLAYACAVARLIYRRSPLRIPDANDPVALAAMHKAAYNTALGATDASESVQWFKKVVVGGPFA